MKSQMSCFVLTASEISLFVLSFVLIRCTWVVSAIAVELTYSYIRAFSIIRTTQSTLQHSFIDTWIGALPLSWPALEGRVWTLWRNKDSESAVTHVTVSSWTWTWIPSHDHAVTQRNKWALSFSSPVGRTCVSVHRYSMCDQGGIILSITSQRSGLCSGGPASENVPQKAVKEKKKKRHQILIGWNHVWMWRTDHISCSVRLLVQHHKSSLIGAVSVTDSSPGLPRC